MKISTIFVLFIIVFAPSVVEANQPSMDSTETLFDEEQVEVRNLSTPRGVNFTVYFYRSNATLSVIAHNANDDAITSAINVEVDKQYLYDNSSLDLPPGRTWKKQWNVSRGVDALEGDHTVTVSTFGNYTRFNFTREVDPETTDIPTPYISNVVVQNGTIEGEPSAVADVTIVNPSIQTYPTKLMVHTTETDGSLYFPTVPPGEKRTVTVELLDERGSRIGGEVRLYAEDFAKGDGAFDQVEFVGQAGGRTNSWNETYEAVNGPWDEDGYEYENESLEPPTLAERLSNGYAIGGYPAIYAIAVVLIVLLGLLRKLR